MAAASAEQIARFFLQPRGRIGRTEFVHGILVVVLLAGAVFTMIAAHGGIARGFAAPVALCGIALTVAEFVLAAKRCHDIGLSGGFALLLLIPFVGFLWLVALAVMPGAPEPNAYGPPPRLLPD
jgi:uncharacterized membrane protein YhaH (DUF805 family)